MIPTKGAKAMLEFTERGCEVLLEGKWARRMADMAYRELDLAIQKQAFEAKKQAALLARETEDDRSGLPEGTGSVLASDGM